MPLLEVKGLNAGYGRGPAILNDTHLVVEAGRVQCLIGPNGAGKSTLLRAICGLLPPRSGEVWFKGRRIDGLPPHEVLKLGVSLIPQERALFPRMTVRENLRMGGFLIKDRQELERRIGDVLEQFPILKERAGQRAATLSGGQQQMLSMARALILRPVLIMLDEPSLGLAPMVVRQMYDIVRMLKERGMTILLVEQNAIVGLQNADHGCVLDLGCTLFEGPAKEVLADPRIQELYLGKAKAA
jgi:branched-chain amino acid transport system ATP-binding protein